MNDFVYAAIIIFLSGICIGISAGWHIRGRFERDRHDDGDDF